VLHQAADSPSRAIQLLVPGRDFPRRQIPAALPMDHPDFRGVNGHARGERDDDVRSCTDLCHDSVSSTHDCNSRAWCNGAVRRVGIRYWISRITPRRSEHAVARMHDEAVDEVR
jgi:hypothetical protein